MHPATIGALVGLGLGALLVLSEYLLLSKAVNERAKRKGQRKAVFSGIERERMKSLVRFSLVLPPAFALGCWIVLPKLGLA